MATLTLTASEFQDRLGEALDRALSQPVLITRQGRPRNVVLSYAESGCAVVNAGRCGRKT